MKFALSISSLLFFTLIILLTFQYEAFSVEKAERPINFTYNQEIDITLQDGKLKVIQHLSGLPKNSLSILWPSDSGQAACVSGTNCERLSPDFSTISEGEEKELSVSYEIPFEHNGGYFLRSIPFASIHGGEVDQTVLHLTDRQKTGGTWLTGLPMIGQQKLSFVDYFLFAGEGEVKELYWQQKQLSMTYKSENVSFYSKEMPSDFMKKTLDSVAFEKHTDLIISAERPVGTNRVLFIRQGNEEIIKRDLAIATIQSSFRLNNKDAILLSVMANLMTDQMEGNSRAKAITVEINKLSEEQRKIYLNNFWNHTDEELNAALLDSLLSEVLKGPVSYFERNVSNRPFFPLVLDESRQVQFDGKPLNVDVIRKDQRVFYSLSPLMDALDFSLSEGEHGLYIDNGQRSFRFPVDEPFYVLNERRYDAPTEPMIKIAGQYYIEEKWLILLFLLDVKKDAEKISIERMDGF
ncbi:hypothetical protein ACFOZY_02620 [Chungangia koreensis]|uniref:Uncharacterized protein n=1 Tax=Chungangia koreensis TaxID=752657 RepID=A0ABV8X5I3_9LACT